MIAPGELALRLARAVAGAADARAALRRAMASRPAGDPLHSGPVTVLAIGKAARPLLAEYLSDPRRSSAVSAALCIGPPGDPVAGADCLVADHPTPAERNVAAAARAVAMIGSSDPSGSVVLLVSGGGSAHLCLPHEGVPLDELRAVTRHLLLAGASIDELNTVRRHAEQTKGGGLLRFTEGRAVEVFAMSDVIGDDPAVIASGPVAADPSTCADALAVLDRHSALPVAPRLERRLRRGVERTEPETIKPGDPRLARVRHTIIGSNADAVRAARGLIESLGVRAEIRAGPLRGDAATEGRALAAWAVDARRGLAPGGAPAALIAGGETTVAVGAAEGIGGRNQELVLAAAVDLEGCGDVLVASIATDGVDGATDAAGAWCIGATAAAGRAAGIDPRAALALHDSGRFFELTGGSIRTGPTGTNVNDVAVALAGLSRLAGA